MLQPPGQVGILAIGEEVDIEEVAPEMDAEMADEEEEPMPKSAPAPRRKAVAAITKSADGIPIIVIRHDPELLTVYANVTDVAVEKGATVAKGQQIAKLRSGNDAYVHFEVRKGFDSVDPMPYLR